MKHWVWIRAEIKNEIAALKNFGKEMKCGPSICGIGGIQIWQRRIPRAVRHAKKRVWISPYTLFPSTLVARVVLVGPHWAALWRPGFGVPPSPYQARVNQLCLFSASRPFTTTPASASFFSRLPVIIGVATSRPISAAWL